MASPVAHYALSFLLSRQVDLLLPRQSTDADHLCLVCTFHADAQHVSVDEIPHIVQCDAWVNMIKHIQAVADSSEAGLRLQCRKSAR